jgi:hypothetical protein
VSVKRCLSRLDISTLSWLLGCQNDAAYNLTHSLQSAWKRE